MKTAVRICLLIVVAVKCFAQHEHHKPMQDSTHNDSLTMVSSFSVNLPMNRDGSGTSWQPDESPMYMYHRVLGKNAGGQTSFMGHGNLFLRYTSQDITAQKDRGGSHFDVPNMMMFTLRQQYRKDIVSLLTMFSFDPFTVGLGGYPLLFQSGESYKGKPLVDKQHPHDLFASLAVNFTHSFTKDWDASIYFGYPGEPSIGPVAFMHRLSAMNNPVAPLGHHWQDATHITFGTGTVGLRYKIVKVEGSIFTGREPDEHRYNFDSARFDSYSSRVSINPNKNLSFQVSSAFIKSPEELFPDHDIFRTTASVLQTKIIDHERFIASSLVWGANHSSEGHDLHSVLFESNYKLKPIAIYSRYEFVQKDAHELQLHDFDEHERFDIHALTLGLNRIIKTMFKTDFSIGVQGTLHFPDNDLKPVYGSSPLSVDLFLKIAPTRMIHF